MNSTELLDPEYNTPRTTRVPRTPTSNGKGKTKYRITHLVYRPLQLDNDSSSESQDFFMRRHEPYRTTPKKIKYKQDTPPLTVAKPLPIRAPPEIITIEDSSSNIDMPSNVDTIERLCHDTPDTNNIQPTQSLVSKVKSQPDESIEPPTKKSRTSDSQTKIDKPQMSDPEHFSEVSQCITPPITPEKSDTKPPLPDFVPGNCGLAEALKYYAMIKTPQSRKTTTKKSTKLSYRKSYNLRNK